MKQIAAFKLVAYAKSCINQHIITLKQSSMINSNLLCLLLKQLIISCHLRIIKPTDTDIESLHAFTFLDSTQVTHVATWLLLRMFLVK